MMEENMIANTMEEKDLGIIIDNKLNFQNHINKQVNKANQKHGLKSPGVSRREVC
jgi:hypothetical protein